MKLKSLVVFNGFIIISLFSIFLSCTIGEDNPTDPNQEEETLPPVETIPQVTTRAVNSINYYSAKSGGEIQLDLKNDIIDRGVCWSTHQNPTTEDHRTYDGSGHGNFTSSIDTLISNTKYYLRAFATSHAGTGYGEELSFTTSSDSNRAYIHDQEGNRIEAVKIGNQWWMAENLQVTHYRNGDPIPNISDDTEWIGLTDGAYCIYDNNQANLDGYGLLYNWYAVTDDRNIAPEGWHVPTDEEWKQLEITLGMTREQADQENWRGDTEGSKLKEKGSEHWYYYGYVSGTNDYGFTALPGGYRNINDGTFIELTFYGMFWTTTEASEDIAINRALHCKNVKIGRILKHKAEGFSVRCVKDE